MLTLMSFSPTPHYQQPLQNILLGHTTCVRICLVLGPQHEPITPEDATEKLTKCCEFQSQKVELCKGEMCDLKRKLQMGESC